MHWSKCSIYRLKNKIKSKFFMANYESTQGFLNNMCAIAQGFYDAIIIYLNQPWDEY
jgi:hypothetical protein